MKGFIWMFGVALAVLLFQNCSARHEELNTVIQDSEGTTSDDVDMAKSLVAYERTLYPLTQDEGSCKDCHGVSQQPLHSVSDINFAHDVTISFGLVNLRDPASSEIVEKIRDGSHNGRGIPQARADELESAIKAWSDELIANGGLIGVGDGVQPTYTSLFENVFEPKCVSCHASDGEAPSIDYTSYVNTINTGLVVPGNAGASGAFIHTANGSEPRGGDTPLTQEELQALAQWINLGALNN